MAKEYIERDAALEALYDNEYTTLCPLDEVSSVIGAIPAADVVEVVRCKDCKYFTRDMVVGICYLNQGNPILPMPYDNYCGFGERMC